MKLIVLILTHISGNLLMVLTILLLLLAPQDGPHCVAVFSSLISIVFVGYTQGRN